MQSSLKKIQWRSFTTFLIVMMFAVLATTGIILYITPPGRIANWSGWQLFGLTKAQWQAVHTIFSFLFVVTAGFHLFFNWKVLMGYLRTRFELHRKYRRELAAASVLVLAVFILTVNHVTPFGTIMDVGENLKNSWSSPTNEPPLPHAELLTLSDFASRQNMPLEAIRRNLESAGLRGGGDSTTLGEIAKRHNLTPQQVYERISKSGGLGGRSTISEGGGYGRRTVADLCVQLGITPEEALKRLQLKSIYARPEQNIRELAMAYGRTPVEIVRVISGETE